MSNESNEPKTLYTKDERLGYTVAKTARNAGNALTSVKNFLSTCFSPFVNLFVGLAAIVRFIIRVVFFSAFTPSLFVYNDRACNLLKNNGNVKCVKGECSCGNWTGGSVVFDLFVLGVTFAVFSGYENVPLRYIVCTFWAMNILSGIHEIGRAVRKPKESA